MKTTVSYVLLGYVIKKLFRYRKILQCFEPVSLKSLWWPFMQKICIWNQSETYTLSHINWKCLFCTKFLWSILKVISVQEEQFLNWTFEHRVHMSNQTQQNWLNWKCYLSGGSRSQKKFLLFAYVFQRNVLH